MARILLVDATNNYLRNYAVVPTLDKNGERNGGVYGTLTTLSYFVKTINPDRIILCWDGKGGSKKRRAILGEYKDGRKAIKPPRINKNFEFEAEDLAENKKKQRRRLAEYLYDLPVTEVIIDDIEADDVIGYLTAYFKDDQKAIASSDKDFFQLLDAKTVIFQPTKKVFYTNKSLVAEYNIYPHNFALARAITGDVSDNVVGVKRVGLKNLLKYFPFMSGEDEVTMDRIFDYSREKMAEKGGEKYQKFLDAEERIRKNYQVVQLKTPLISFSNIDVIQDVVQKPVTFNASVFRSKLFEDGIMSVGDTFFQQFKMLFVKGNG
jgi:5'-3' exonuclease